MADELRGFFSIGLEAAAVPQKPCIEMLDYGRQTLLPPVAKEFCRALFRCRPEDRMSCYIGRRARHPNLWQPPALAPVPRPRAGQSQDAPDVGPTPTSRSWLVPWRMQWHMGVCRTPAERACLRYAKEVADHCCAAAAAAGLVRRAGRGVWRTGGRGLWRWRHSAWPIHRQVPIG